MPFAGYPLDFLDAMIASPALMEKVLVGTKVNSYNKGPADGIMALTERSIVYWGRSKPMWVWPLSVIENLDHDGDNDFVISVRGAEFPFVFTTEENGFTHTAIEHWEYLRPRPWEPPSLGTRVLRRTTDFPPHDRPFSKLDSGDLALVTAVPSAWMGKYDDETVLDAEFGWDVTGGEEFSGPLVLTSKQLVIVYQNDLGGRALSLDLVTGVASHLADDGSRALLAIDYWNGKQLLFVGEASFIERAKGYLIDRNALDKRRGRQVKKFRFSRRRF